MLIGLCLLVCGAIDVSTGMEVQEAAGVPLMSNSMELCSIGGLTGAGAIIGRGSDGLTLAIPSGVVLTISLLVLVRNAGQEGLLLSACALPSLGLRR